MLFFQLCMVLIWKWKYWDFCFFKNADLLLLYLTHSVNSIRNVCYCCSDHCLIAGSCFWVEATLHFPCADAVAHFMDIEYECGVETKSASEWMSYACFCLWARLLTIIQKVYTKCFECIWYILLTVLRIIGTNALFLSFEVFFFY